MKYTSLRTLFRPRVNSALLGAVTHFPLTVLVAPMGYGKSTAAGNLTECIHAGKTPSATSFRKVLTFAASQEVTEAAYVWDRLFAQFAAQGSESAEKLKKTGFPLGSDGRHRFLSLCRDIAEHHTDKILIILDDWQFAESRELNFLLECLVKENLSAFSFLILSRTRPDLPLEEFGAKGLACEFDLHLPSFSPDETIELFASYGENNPRARKAALAVHTLCDGWPIAVWLYLKQYLAGKAPSIAHNSTASAEAEAILQRNIYEPYPDEDKRLLLSLAVPDSFTADTAVFISGNPTARHHLASLGNDNAFITRDPQGIYRLHAMFRAFLRKCLEGEEGIRLGLSLPVILRRVAEVHRASNDMVQAIYTLHKAGREEDQARILELFTLPDKNTGMVLDPQGISAIVLSLPDKIKLNNPMGWIAFIFHVVSGADPSPAPTLLNNAEKLFLAKGNLEPNLALRVEGELALVRAFLNHGDPMGMSVGFRKAFHLLQRTGDPRSTIMNPEQPWLATSPHAGFLYHTIPGQYEYHVQIIEQNLEVFLMLSGGCGTGAAELMRAEKLLDAAELSGLTMYLQQGEYRAKGKNQLSIRIALAFTQARALLYQYVSGTLSQGGERQACCLPLWALEEEVGSAGHPSCVMALELAQGYMLTLLDKANKVALWIQEGDWYPQHRFCQGLGAYSIVRGKTLLGLNRFHELISFCEKMKTALRPPEAIHFAPFGLLHMYALQAIAFSAIHQMPPALEAFNNALTLAQSDDLVLSLGEYGHFLLPLIRQVRKKHKTNAFLARLHKTANAYAHDRKSQNRVHLRLSPREKIILEQASLGLTNKQIAAVLGLAPTTVRNTLSRTYTKLNVRNRTQAIGVWEKYRSKQST